MLRLPSDLNPVGSSAAALRWVARDKSILCICPTLEAGAQYWCTAAAERYYEHLTGGRPELAGYKVRNQDLGSGSVWGMQETAVYL